MREIEIKKLGPKNIFKIMTYITCVPLGFMALIGLVFMIIGGPASGIPLTFMSIVFIFIYGLIGMLAAIVYNNLSSKFGGLKLVIEEEKDLITKDQKTNS